MPGRVRAAVVIVEVDLIAVIERRRGSRRYHVLPGGGVEDGETVEDAATREAFEELGVRVELLGLVATVDFTRDGSTSRQHHFAAKIIDGELGTGSGPEYTTFDPSRGSYRAGWMSLEDAEQNQVPPRALIEALGRRGVASLLRAPLSIVEDDRQPSGHGTDSL